MTDHTETEQRISDGRRKCLAALGGSMAVGLAGCIGNLPGTGGSNQLEEPIELYTWNLPFLEESIQGWLKDFEQAYGDEYKNLQTKWTDRGPGTEEILAYFQSRLQGGDPPHVFDTQMATFARYTQDDIWVDLNQYANNDLKKQYYDRLFGVMTIDDQLVNMPFYMGTSATYTRTKWFEEAEIDPPSIDTFYSADKYLDVAEQLVENSGAKFGLTFIRFNWQIWPWFASEGITVLTEDGSKVAFNTKRTHELLTRFRDLTEKNVIPDVSWTGNWKPAAEQFGSGNTGMYFGSGSALRLIQNYGSKWVTEDTMGVAGAPKADRYGGLLTMHGLGVVKPDTSQREHRAAFDLITIILNKKWQKDFLKNTTVLVPHKQAVEEVRNDTQFGNENPLLIELYALWDTVSSDVWVPPLIPAASEMAQIIDTQFSAAALGEKSVDEAINAAEKQCNAALQR